MGEETKRDPMEWMGLQHPDWSRATWIGPFFGFILVILIVLLVVSAIAAILHLFSLVVFSNVDHEAVRNIGLAVVAILGAPFVVWRAVVAQKQADTAEQSHITDQINKAVAGLGAEKTADRIGRPVKVYFGKSTTVTMLGSGFITNK